ncbi:MAG: hypothetical protein H8E75_08930 [Puniceicoccaceae bacterium]|nr:hypothetical protein [Puniceicoccaceae bacterium]
MLAAFEEVGVGGEDLADGTRLWVVTKAGEGILVEGKASAERSSCCSDQPIQ